MKKNKGKDPKADRAAARRKKRGGPSTEEENVFKGKKKAEKEK